MKGNISVVNTGSELYVYWKKELIYKKWLTNGQRHGKVFHGGEGETQFIKKK